MRPHYWIVWSHVAVDHEREAASARSAWISAHHAGGDVDLAPEWHASVIGIAAAAFAIDAWYGELQPLIAATGRLSPRRGRPRRNAIILEALKVGFRIGSKTQTWQQELDWLFKEQRDGLVHPVTENEQVTTLAPGVQGSPAHVRHSALTTTRAVNLMIDLFQTCATTATGQDLAELMTKYKPSIDDLTSRRS
jgi:hypothetical protein